eukprot:gnl/MRDRNA2_/MRDRNA2_85283_c0_seq1.p1 gnl/MRDRNA2_/MRDRNA2_85283_c0~~gnl/MRDRNA2_/MRDRNA2_85283_c0_seq1.p1  ORF type:complete len:410 (-),score=98.76 gnl/MRDRNA2_/MRDRNA2_85283_c0_seq1:99-1328(-)
MALRRPFLFVPSVLSTLALTPWVLQLCAAEEEAPWGDAVADPKMAAKAMKVCGLFANVNSEEALAQTSRVFPQDGIHWIQSLMAMAFKTRGEPKAMELCLGAISNVIWYDKKALDGLREGIVGYGPGAPFLLRIKNEVPKLVKVQESILVSLAALVEGEEGEDDALEMANKIDEVVLGTMKKLKKEKRIQKAGILFLSKLQLNRPVIQQEMLAFEDLVPVAADAALKLTGFALEINAINLFYSLAWLGKSKDDEDFADQNENATRVTKNPKVFEVVKRSMARHAKKEPQAAVGGLRLVSVLPDHADSLHPSIVKSALEGLAEHSAHPVYGPPLIRRACEYLSKDTDAGKVVEDVLRDMAAEENSGEIRSTIAAHVILRCGDKVRLGEFTEAAKAAVSTLESKDPAKEEL